MLCLYWCYSVFGNTAKRDGVVTGGLCRGVPGPGEGSADQPQRGWHNQDACHRYSGESHPRRLSRGCQVIAVFTVQLVLMCKCCLVLLLAANLILFSGIYALLLDVA